MAFASQLALVRIVAFLLFFPPSGPNPAIPQIDHCVSFWLQNITCYWDLLPEAHPPTTYTLHITEESGRCQGDFSNPGQCAPRQGERSCGVPVENLFAFYKIQLTAENQGVRVSSLEKCIHGMGIVKLSPPTVNVLVANQSRCFQLEWSLPGDEVLFVLEAQYEIQYRDMAEMSWMQVNFTAAENGQAFANVCGVFPFTNYSVRVRAKSVPSPLLKSEGSPFWSEWSPERYVRTLPAVPSQGPALWRKFRVSGADGKRDIILMWKPLKPKEANGEILTYTVFSQQKNKPAIPLRLTQDLQCIFRIPAKEGYTFLITASNILGASPVTKLVVPPFNGQEEPPSLLHVLASPVTDHSLLLRWIPPHFPEIRYVFEWGQLPRKLSDETFWHHHSSNTDHMVITEAIAPGNLYNIKVFALVDGNVWALGSTSAYSKQIAPLRAPTLYPTRVWKAQVELRWETLPLEERGGVIQNYTLCYKEEGKKEKAVVLDGSIQHYLIEDLAPNSVVRVYLTATTEGGSTRGPVLSIQTKSDDYGEAEVMLSAFFIGFLLLLLISGSLACVYKQQWLQKYLWPQIPDPGKSNVATWIPSKKNLGFSPPSTEKWRQDYLRPAIGDILMANSYQTDSKTVSENQWQVEAPNTIWKIDPIPGTADSSWHHGNLSQDGPTNRNMVDYSKVFMVQTEDNLEQPRRSPYGSQARFKRQDLESSYSGSPFGPGVWLSNWTYGTLEDDGLHKATFEPTGEFPLLVNLVALEQ